MSISEIRFGLTCMLAQHLHLGGTGSEGKLGRQAQPEIHSVFYQPAGLLSCWQFETYQPEAESLRPYIWQLCC